MQLKVQSNLQLLNFIVFVQFTKLKLSLIVYIFKASNIIPLEFFPSKNSQIYQSLSKICQTAIYDDFAVI